MNDKNLIFYICDRKVCLSCNNPECNHTLDPMHAKNFVRHYDLENEDERLRGAHLWERMYEEDLLRADGKLNDT